MYCHCPYTVPIKLLAHPVLTVNDARDMEQILNVIKTLCLVDSFYRASAVLLS